MGQSYRTDGPGVSSSHPLHFLSSHPHHDLVSGGDSSVSIKEMENKKHNPTSTAAAGNQCTAVLWIRDRCQQARNVRGC